MAYQTDLVVGGDGYLYLKLPEEFEAGQLVQITVRAMEESETPDHLELLPAGDLADIEWWDDLDEDRGNG